MKKIRNRLLAFTLSLLFVLSGLPLQPVISEAATPETMEVHFLDVGQGDTTLIKCGGKAMLIDAGDDTKGTAIQNYLQKQDVKKLDYLILTHPDADHIGGAPVVITKFQIDKVFVSDFEKDNKTYQKLIQALDNKRLKYTTPETGTQYTLGSAVITILGPVKKYDNPNDSSVALLVQNGSNRFLFTGDAEEAAEKDIVKNNRDIAADVYHAGHHGSRTSTSETLFQAVSPKYAVISCAEGNSYGHPHAQTLNTFRMNGVKVYRTDEEGTIVATSDGSKIQFSVPPSETWKAGEPSGSSADGTAAARSKASAGETAAGSGETGWKAGTVSGVTGQKAETGSGETGQKTAAPSRETIQETTAEVTNSLTYVLNVKTKKFHRPTCGSLPTTNRKDSSESRDDIISKGYAPCKKCNP